MMVEKGVEVSADDLDKKCGTFVIQDNKVAVYRGGKKIGDATIKVGAGTSPAQFDLKPDNEGKEIGIYKIEMDTLTLCISMDSKAYPAKFESTKDTNTELLVFKKSKK